MTHAIIIGSTRCGTTSLYNYLGAHPSVKMAKKGGKREVHFFDYEHLWKKGIDWYWQQFPTTEATVTLETSPTMLHHRGAPMRLKEHIPGCRIIVCLRNPIDRAYSDYWLARRKHWTNSTFENHIHIERRLLEHEQCCPDFWENHYYLSETHLCGFLDRGMYARHLRRWFDCFPSEHIMIIKSEQLFADPSFQTLAIWSWLGLRRAPLPRFRHWQSATYEAMPRKTRHWLQQYYEQSNRELKELVGWSW